MGDKNSGFAIELGVGLTRIFKPIKLELLEPVQFVPFEEGSMPIPTSYDEYLRIVYGDYMSLPSEDERIARHTTVLVDTEQPFTESVREQLIREEVGDD